MNPFKKSTQKFIHMHGRNVTIAQVSGTYNIETGTATNTSANSTVKAYKKHLKASQYNYPNLINKDISEFYFYAPDLASEPEPKDKITQGSEVFTVEVVQKHEALGEVLLYIVIASRG